MTDHGEPSTLKLPFKAAVNLLRYVNDMHLPAVAKGKRFVERLFLYRTYLPPVLQRCNLSSTGYSSGPLEPHLIIGGTDASPLVPDRFLSVSRSGRSYISVQDADIVRFRPAPSLFPCSALLSHLLRVLPFFFVGFRCSVLALFLILVYMRPGPVLD